MTKFEHISEEERQHLLSKLHRLLVWVGEPLPETIENKGEIVNIHDIIWWCIHKKEFSEQEKERFTELIRLLEKKEKSYEEILQRDDISCKDARKLYHEIASIIRAIIDIKECELGKAQLQESDEGTRHKIEDAKRWIGFLKTVGKKEN